MPSSPDENEETTQASSATELLERDEPQKEQKSVIVEEMEEEDVKGGRISTLGSISRILMTGAIITIPMIVVPVTLLVLVFRYQKPTIYTNPVAELDMVTVGVAPGFYYVDISATTLVFLASWVSTISMSLTTAMMGLLSYVVARDLLRRSKGATKSTLPTPFQMSLLINILSGSVLDLWTWIQSSLVRRRSRKAKSVPVEWSAAILGLTILAGLLVSAADTWLHIRTTTQSIYRTTLFDRPISDAGRGFSEECLLNMNIESSATGDEAICTVISNSSKGSQLQYAIRNADVSIRTVANISTQHMVYSLSDFVMSYDGPLNTSTPAAFLGPAAFADDIDFGAMAFALATTCKPITESCIIHRNMSSSNEQASTLTFDCSKGHYNISFAGNLTDVSWQMAYLDDYDDNAVHWALASSIESDIAATNFNNTRNLSFEGDSMYSIFLCNSSAWEYGFSMEFGRPEFSGLPSRANKSVLANLMRPMDPVVGLKPVQLQLQSDLRLAALDAGNASTFAYNFAGYFNQRAIGFSAGSMSPRQSWAAQKRWTQLLSAVPKKPLWMLAGLCFVYAASGIALTCLAVIVTLEDKRVRDVQKRLNVAGLAAAVFESDVVSVNVTSRNGVPAEEGNDKARKRVGFEMAEDGVLRFTSFDS